MTVHLRRLDDNFLFETLNEEGLSVRTDASPDIGGGGAALRPMEMLLASLASCSGIDVVLLLRKQRQNLQDIEVRVEGDRRDREPRVFTRIRVHYILTGPTDERKVERACRLSMEKLCSVSTMLAAGGVDISWTYELRVAV